MIRRILINLHDWLFRGPPAAALPADWTWDGELPAEPLTDLLHPDVRCWNVEGEWKRHSFFLDGQPVPTCRRCGTTSPYLTRARAMAE